MTKPTGVPSKLKDNTKHPQACDDWNKGKRLGRPKQVWVWEEPMAVPAGEQPTGHWTRA